MCSRLGCLAGHKVNASNGLSVNGVIKIGLQEDKSNVYNVCEPGRSGIVCTCTVSVTALCISSYIVLQ